MKHDFLDYDHIQRSNESVEYHPLKPFLPANASVLFLGSFPPPRKRWGKDFNFFYPNFINDHWRIIGQLFFQDKNHFVDPTDKRFKLDDIVSFLSEVGIAYYDTSTAIRRLKENASDKFLEVVEYTNVEALLKLIPACRVVVTTGEKATESLCRIFGIEELPKVGTCVPLPSHSGLCLYRLPSSSRAYPLSLDKKVEAYRQMFTFTSLL